ncbi:MAG TPA: thiamine pyrophosphate-dependent dehydrogenase E1 component subunit alpha, partial [Polyangiaceae bacterium]|nr:thiamine pyrophosphate-dependent dehydrogenase E1 component subunit alpha [Polyangiaceae bacterium]
RLKGYLAKHYAWTDDKDKELEAEVDAELRAAIKVSEETAQPSLDSMFEEVFAELPWHLQEQRDELKSGPRAKKH